MPRRRLVSRSSPTSTNCARTSHSRLLIKSTPESYNSRVLSEALKLFRPLTFTQAPCSAIQSCCAQNVLDIVSATRSVNPHTSWSPRTRDNNFGRVINCEITPGKVIAMNPFVRGGLGKLSGKGLRPLDHGPAACLLLFLLIHCRSDRYTLSNCSLNPFFIQLGSPPPAQSF